MVSEATLPSPAAYPAADRNLAVGPCRASLAGDTVGILRPAAGGARDVPAAFGAVATLAAAGNLVGVGGSRGPYLPDRWEGGRGSLEGDLGEASLAGDVAAPWAFAEEGRDCGS